MLAAGVHTYVAERDDAAVDARVGYGLRLPAGGLLTPFGGYGQMGAARRAPGRSRGWTATGGRP